MFHFDSQELARSLSDCPLGLGFSALVTVTAISSRTKEMGLQLPYRQRRLEGAKVVPLSSAEHQHREKSSPTLTAEMIDVVLLKGL